MCCCIYFLIQTGIYIHIFKKICLPITVCIPKKLFKRVRIVEQLKYRILDRRTDRHRRCSVPLKKRPRFGSPSFSLLVLATYVMMLSKGPAVVLRLKHFLVYATYEVCFFFQKGRYLQKGF